MTTSAVNVLESGTQASYALGNSDAEHERLIRQAETLAPCTERFFRDAGISVGHRVLDIGSVVGDVAMLLAGIVGPSGEVVGVERDSRSIARARARVAEAKLANVTFTQSDASEISANRLFDAVAGRFILMYLPDPVAVLRMLSRLVRPGGIVAFQEPCMSVPRLVWAHLSLYSKAASLIYATFRCSGANPDAGLDMFSMFEKAGLPVPAMRMEVLLENCANPPHWARDILRSLQPEIERAQLPVDALGDFDSFSERLQAEVAAANTVVPYVSIVGAWSRREAKE